MGAAGGVNVSQVIKQDVLRLGAFGRRGGAVQVLAAGERTKPQRPQQGQLLFNWLHSDVQAQAVGMGPLAWRAGPVPPLFEHAADVTQKDEFELELERQREILQACQREKGLSSCFACEAMFECKTRKKYVDAVYSSMSKGDGGGFDF